MTSGETAAPAAERLPRLAIVISTLDRHPALAATLDGLAKSDLSAADEILIVDQSAVAFDASAWASRVRVPVRVLHERTRGLGSSRNAALRTVDAEVLLFLDDDIVPDPGIVREHARTYVERPNAMGVAGHETLPPDRRSSPLRAAARRALLSLLGPWLRASPRLRSFLDDQGRPAAILLPGGIFLCDFAHERACRVMTPRGCNMSFRRDALRAVGGFDEAFVGPRRDESDLALRLLAAFPEREIWFNPRARVLHLMSPTGGVREAPGRERHARLLRCEMLFARRHLGVGGRALCRLRLLLENPGAFLRHPGLLGCLFEA